jgi:Xaa-Pro dipeptidase
MAPADLRISRGEHSKRIEKIRTQLKRRRVTALYLTSPTRILYASGFSHIPTERPLALVIPVEEPMFFLCPQLEYDHIKAESELVEDVFTYPDYPGRIHPIRVFAKQMSERGLGSAVIATDSPDGATGGYGYRGPSLREIMSNAKFLDGRDFVDSLRLVKSKQEVRLLRESAKWSEIAHDLLFENTRPGLHDALVGVKSSLEALAKMLKRVGHSYVQVKIALSPVVVGFRGQVGKGSAIPHAVYSKDRIRSGDVLVTEAGVEVEGYTSELERTVVVGKPSSKAKKYFEAMVKAQDAAFSEFRAGRPCSSVDAVANRAVEESGLSEALRHHTGHGIGLEGHEPPWLDPGDRTIMREGMVFSCEPGLYVPGYAGFRHSDTIAITRKGMDFITHYPRDLESLTIR